MVTKQARIMCFNFKLFFILNIKFSTVGLTLGGCSRIIFVGVVRKQSRAIMVEKLKLVE